ncbi:MAG: tetratricopeptide repeat protein [Isosphaeraceae bacterium]
MNRRSRNLIVILVVVVVVLLVAGSRVLGLWRVFKPIPTLDAICALARDRQFDRAQQLMGRYLRADPENDLAHLLMAQFALDRPDPQTRLALDHLSRVRPCTPRQAAVLRFTEGKAHYLRKRYDLAEESWKEALKLDPKVPEAGWALLDLLDLEARVEEAHQLCMRMYEIEPDPRDRIRYLLEAIRVDIDKVAPGSQVPIFEPLVKEHPENLPLSLVVGLALVHDSRGEEGLKVLRAALDRYPDSADAWDGWLTGLADGFQPDELVREWGRLPQALAADPRFAKHEGVVAQQVRDRARAIRAYRRAVKFEPFNGPILYRLRLVLQLAGKSAEAQRVDRDLTAYQAAFKQVRGVYQEALQVPTLGLLPHPELYQRLADLREKMGRLDEAGAWHRLVLRDRPDDPVSLAALSRLK